MEEEEDGDAEGTVRKVRRLRRMKREIEEQLAAAEADAKNGVW